jgi:hypothetical protein
VLVARLIFLSVRNHRINYSPVRYERNFWLLVSHLRCHYRTLRTLTPNYSVMSLQDGWPKMPGGSHFDGKQLLTLVRSGNCPLHGVWDVNLLTREIEENLAAQVIDIPVT